MSRVVSPEGLKRGAGALFLVLGVSFLLSSGQQRVSAPEASTPDDPARPV